MNRLRIQVKQLLRRVGNSIAFFPTIIAVGFLLLAFVVMAVEYEGWMLSLKHQVDFLFVKSVEDGRLILGTLVASTISLMVFSFSMVMIVLNQASANLSPRLIPGLISEKANQTVLGFYLGTIIYCLVLIINIMPEGQPNQIPAFGIFLALCAGITCLGLFAYFIHSISNDIQVDTILDELFTKTQKRMKAAHTDEQQPRRPDQEWHTLKTQRSGYLKWVEHDDLLALCCKHDLTIILDERIGYFCVSNYPYLKISRKVEKEVEKQIHHCFMFYPQERLGDHYSFGFKQISEIAIKALSPSINDPGTAMKAMDMLTMLFIIKIGMQEICVLRNGDDEPRIWLTETDLDYLLYTNLTPIRAYAQHDALVMHRMLDGLYKILLNDKEQTHTQSLQRHIQAVRDSCEQHISNHMDRSNINRLLLKINLVQSGGEQKFVTLLSDAGNRAAHS